MPFIMGIDPGLKGAICILSYKGKVKLLEPMPVKAEDYDYLALNEILSFWKDRVSMCFLEKQWAFKGQGVTSSFNLGRGYGILQGMLGAWTIPTELVASRTWQKEFNDEFDIDKELSTKQRASIMANNLYPDSDFRVGKARKEHDGLVDSILIAEYGRRRPGIALTFQKEAR